jgi:photosystem II stability/assembly factor-like uncharacterized protein
VTVTGNSTRVEHRFAVAAGQASSFLLKDLPLGKDAFAAFAYEATCSSVDDATSVASWLSDTVPAVISPGVVTDVGLTMRRNPGGANVSVNFTDAAVPTDGAVHFDAGHPGEVGSGGCGPYADGDVWDKTYDFQQPPFVPLAVGPSGRLYSGFYRGYAFSDNDGQSWTVKDLSALIPARQPWPEPAVSDGGTSMWLFLRGQGTLVSRDGGGTFARVTALSSLSSFDSGRVLISPYHDRHLLAYGSREDASGSLAGSLYRSIDGGNTWVNLDGALAAAGANGAHAATFDPNTPDHFWVTDMPEGVLETTDGGGSFAEVPGSTHSSISNVARTFDGTDFRLVVTGACDAATSTVIGRNAWQPSVGDSPSCCPFPVAIADPFDPSSTVLEQCHDEDPANLRFSTNGGVTFGLATWPTSLDVTTPPTLHVTSVHVDPHHRRTFYAVHLNQFTILKSTDGGQNWTAVGWLPGHGC